MSKELIQVNVEEQALFIQREKAFFEGFKSQLQNVNTNGTSSVSIGFPISMPKTKTDLQDQYDRDISKIVEKLRGGIKTLALDKNSSISVGTLNAHGMQVKLQSIKVSDLEKLAERLQSAYEGKTNEKQERSANNNNNRAELKRSTNNEKILEKSLPLFTEFYQKWDTAYDYAIDNKECAFSIAVKGIEKNEFPPLVESLKTARGGIKCHNKDSGQKTNIMELTRDSDNLVVHFALKNLDYDTRKKDFSFCRNFWANKGKIVNENNPNDREFLEIITPNPNHTLLRDSFRGLFQSSIKENFEDVYDKINGPEDLKKQEAQISRAFEKCNLPKYECLINGTVEIPLTTLTAEAAEKFRNNIKKFEDVTKDGKPIFTVNAESSDKIVIGVKNAPIHSLDPAKIIKLHKGIEQGLSGEELESHVELKSSSGSSVSINSPRSERGENFSLQDFLQKNPNHTPTGSPRVSPRGEASLSSSGAFART
jgi:hypothetical protein